MLFLILIAALFSGLLQLVTHLAVLMYHPGMRAVPRYVLGTLGLLLPPTILLAVWADAAAILLVWACATASGLAVMGARAIGEKLISHRDEKNELERLRMLLDAKAQEEE